MMMKKVLIPLIGLLVCLALAGCFGANNEPEATPAPNQSPSAGMAPDANLGASDGNNAGGGNNAGSGGAGTGTGTDSGAGAGAGSGTQGNGSAYDWAGNAGAVEGRIGMFSEIQECRIAVAEGTALVGVRFADAYQGEMTQRIRDMIAGEVMAADTSVQVVAVTAEPGDVEKVFSLADAQKNRQQSGDFTQQIQEIARNTTTLR